MKKLVITDTARADLKGIARYTEREWGIGQRRRYLAAIEKRLAGLRERPGAGAPRDGLAPGYRSVTSGQHVIFFRVTPSAVEILGVLHHRMDVRRRLGRSRP